MKAEADQHTRITRGGHVATGTSAERREKTARNGTKKSASTRQALITAAREVFVEMGYLDARVSDIVAKANVAHGSFYTYFRSKREVFQAVVDQVGTLIADAVTHRSEDTPGDSLANLERANRRYLRVHHENARILTLVEQVATADPEVQATRIAARAEHVARVERTIAGLQDRGIADPDLDLHVTAGALVSMLSSYSHWSTLDPDYDEDRVVSALTQIWIRAIRLDPSSPTRITTLSKATRSTKAVRSTKTVRDE
ncbi:hypothetical protein GCM10023094_11650 [Rhodococcus olei]|uniref:HTH tetR-type domain-containing protein n=1 Tax=Rhodococcus olei TaxID=2161675 RepID=A0ABP8NYM4_9NOCA